MPVPTPGYVKNIIRRSFREIIDPGPGRKQVQEIWKFFNSECVYCGKKLKKEQKEGHMDHLVSSSCRGSNQISNRVLSCASCNEKEKLDMPWEKFLIQKNSNKSILVKRKDKILQWQKLHKERALSNEILNKIKSVSDKVESLYDEQIKLARDLKSISNK